VTLPSAARHRFDQHSDYLKQFEPSLALKLDEPRGRARIVGDLRVPGGGSIVRDVQIEIRYQGVNPSRLPDTYDPVLRFPPSPERHIEPDGRMCLWLPQTAPRDFGTEGGLSRHLNRVREFIVLQFMYEIRCARNLSPAWPGAAWDHGVNGHAEWIREQLVGLPPCDLNIFRRDLLRGRGATSPDSPCPCRSGRSFRRCHRQFTEMMKRLAAKDQALREAMARMLRDST